MASHISLRSTSARVTAMSPRTTPAAHSSERSRKSAGSNSASEMPISCAWAGRSILFCINGFCTMTCSGVDDADQVRQQLRAAPGRDQAERDLGQGDRRGARRQGAVLTVQRELEPAAHHRAVDEGERRHARLAQAGEDPMPAPAHLQHVGVGAQAWDAGEVGADAEDVRLAGDRHERRVGREGLVEGGVEAGQPARAERVGLGVVVPVVQGDQRRWPVEAGHADQPQQRPGDDLVGELVRSVRSISSLLA